VKQFALMVAIAAIATPASSQPDSQTAAHQFGARQNIWGASLSPDGKHVAFLSPMKGAGAAVLIVDLTTGNAPQPILSSSGHPDRLSHCNWVSNERLVCAVFMISDTGNGKLTYTREVALNLDGSNVKELSAKASVRAFYDVQNGGDIIDFSGDGKGDGSVLMTREFGVDQSTGTIIANQQSGMGIEIVDTNTLKRRPVLPPRKEAEEYIADGQGAIRVMGVMPLASSGYVSDHEDYFYRPVGSTDWRRLSTVTYSAAGASGFDPEAVDPGTNVAYGFDEQDGHRALFKIALDGSLKRDVVLSQPDADVDGLLTVGRQNRVVGATFATDKRKTIFFDPQLKTLQASLGRALPQLPLVDFTDASADENELLLFAGSDVDPGRYYIFDKTSRKLSELLPVRPELASTRLASVQSISYKAADGTMIPAYLTLPPGSNGKGLPAIVMPHGGPASRDEWGFDWLSQYFANQGFAVIQPEFRGSAGYGESWFQKNGFQSWKTAIGDVDDAGRYLLSSGTAAPGRLGIFGWSYGGYAALQGAIVDPDLFKAIVAVAPVTDLQMTKDEARRFTNYTLVATEIGTGIHVVAGSPLQNVDMIKAPVLLFHGDQDMNVDVAQSRAMAAKLKSRGKTVEYVEFKGLDHQLDDDNARAELLQKAAELFKQTLGQ
jgi:dipeptidyl aminopeptidase/acylaminoacyl peptidase